MLKINIHEAKTYLSRYLRRVKDGETILLCERNVPIAELSPLTETKKHSHKQRPLGLDSGKVRIADDWDSHEVNAEIERMFGMSDFEHIEPK